MKQDGTWWGIYCDSGRCEGGVGVGEVLWLGCRVSSLLASPVN